MMAHLAPYICTFCFGASVGAVLQTIITFHFYTLKRKDKANGPD